jgi:hypothetical protein
MTVAGNKLFVSGPPDLVDERQAFHNPDDPDIQARLKRQAAAYEGSEGGELWVVDKANGNVVTRYALKTIPVFDGMAAAGDSLYLATTDGCILRLSGAGRVPLPKIEDKPIRNAWDKPEDPSYLLPVGSAQKNRRR